MSTIQELIDEYARSKNPDFYKKIIQSVQTVNKLWAAYSPVTKNTYMEYFGGKPSAFIFSEKAFCENFKEHLAVHKIEIETELCKSENRIQFFNDLFRCGVENIILDNGQQFIVIDIFDIIEKPDFSSLPKIEQPVLNQSLMVIANLFFQTFKSGTATKNTRTKLLRSLYQAKYLLPVIIDRNTPLDGLENSFLKAIHCVNGTIITIPALKLENGDTLIPFFTDWTEFSRFDRDKQCAGNVVNFNDIEYFCSQGEKIAINPFGFNMVIANNAIDLIKGVSSDIIIDENYFEEINEDKHEEYQQDIYGEYSNEYQQNTYDEELNEYQQDNYNEDSNEYQQDNYDEELNEYQQDNYDEELNEYQQDNYDEELNEYQQDNYDEDSNEYQQDNYDEDLNEYQQDNYDEDSNEYQQDTDDEEYDEYQEDVSEDNFEKNEEQISLFELRSVPNDMIKVLQNIMIKNDIYTAYLKGINHGNSMGYLVIVDFDCDKSTLNNMAEQVQPYTRGISIEFILLDSDLGQRAAKSTYPFYQKN